MKYKFRAHPLMILSLLKPFLFVLIIPVIKGIVQYLLSGNVSGIVSFEIVLFVFIMLIAVFRFRGFLIEIDNDKLIITSGAFFIRKSIIKISKLSSVQSAKSPIDSVLGAVTFRINTEAGKKGRSDFEFKLSNKDSQNISKILYGVEGNKAIKFSLYKLALMAATTSSAVTGLIISVPIINRTGNLIGIAINQMVIDEISNVSENTKLYFPPIVNTITLVFLFGYIAAFIYSFFKFVNFRLFLDKSKIVVKTGFIVRKRTAFYKKAINDVRIEQTPLMRIVKRFSMKVSVGGYGDVKRESAVIVPCAKHGEIKQQFSLYFPFLIPDGNSFHAARGKKSKNRFLFLPKLYALIIMGIVVTTSIIFSYFNRVIIFLGFIAMCIIIYYANLCLFNYYFGKVRFGKNNIYAKSSKGFSSCELYCPKENVGQIKLIQYPFDIKINTCKVVITIRSESADTIRVRHLNLSDVKNSIYECFNIDE